MKFEYYNPVQIKSVDNLGNVFEKHLTDKSLLVISRSAFKRFCLDFEKLIPEGCLILQDFESNPHLDSILKLRQKINYNHFQSIVAIGGGSALDTAKALAVNSNQEEFLSLLHGKKIENLQTLELIAVPTTAGTGSEVTPWATIWDFHQSKKLSLFSQKSWPSVCYCIPELILSVPKEITIQTGLDALSHSMESIWNINRNYISTQFAIQASQKIIQSLPKLIEDLGNLSLRRDMQIGSTLAGLAFSNTKTATAHALSYQFTIENNLPHGIACSFTLPAIMQTIFNSKKSQELLSNDELNEIKFALRKIWGDNPVKAINQFFTEIEVSSNFRDYNIEELKLIENFEGVLNNPRGKNGIAHLPTLKEIMLDEPAP